MRMNFGFLCCLIIITNGNTLGDENCFRVRKTEVLNSIRSDEPTAGFVATIRNGRTYGVEVKRKFKKFAKLVNYQWGDIIYSINKVRLDSNENIFKVWKELKRCPKTIVAVIDRNGQFIELRYCIL